MLECTAQQYTWQHHLHAMHPLHGRAMTDSFVHHDDAEFSVLLTLGAGVHGMRQQYLYEPLPYPPSSLYIGLGSLIAHELLCS